MNFQLYPWAAEMFAVVASCTTANAFNMSSDDGDSITGYEAKFLRKAFNVAGYKTKGLYLGATDECDFTVESLSNPGNGITVESWRGMYIDEPGYCIQFWSEE